MNRIIFKCPHLIKVEWVRTAINRYALRLGNDLQQKLKIQLDISLVELLSSDDHFDIINTVICITSLKTNRKTKIYEIFIMYMSILIVSSLLTNKSFFFVLLLLSSSITYRKKYQNKSFNFYFSALAFPFILLTFLSFPSLYIPSLPFPSLPFPSLPFPFLSNHFQSFLWIPLCIIHHIPCSSHSRDIFIIFCCCHSCFHVNCFLFISTLLHRASRCNSSPSTRTAVSTKNVL